MNLSKTQYNEIEQYAEAFMSGRDIAFLLSLSEEQTTQFLERIKNHKHSKEYIAFHRGRLKSKYALRKEVVNLAKMGSQTAQIQAEKYFKECK